jgi:putative ABC transport system permease protein
LPGVAVVSHAFWQSKLGGDLRALGRSITLDGDSFTVVGVAAPEFRFPLDGKPADVWLPLHGAIDKQARQWRSMIPYRSVIARLPPGVQAVGAQTELDVIHARLA